MVLVYLIFLAGIKPSYADAGCLVGAAIGAAAGSLIGDGTGQVVAMITGGAVGCHVGSHYSNHHHQHYHHRHYVDPHPEPEFHGGHIITSHGPRRVGYTRSRSIYYDQRPEVFGIIPPHRHTIYNEVGCSLQSNGQPYLREYTMKVTIGGRLQDAYGQACYTLNGDWKIVSYHIQ